MTTRSARRWYSVAEVRRSFGPEKRWAEREGALPASLIYRPISFWLTPPLLWMGVPPTAVTLASAVISVVLPWVAWAGGAHAYLYVALLGLIFHVCDCLDGNLARTAEQTSHLGAILDGFVDSCFRAGILAAIGVLACRSGGGGLVATHGLEVGLGIALLFLLSRVIRDSYALRFRERPDFSPAAPERLSLTMRLKIAVIGLEDLYAFAIVAAGWFGAIDRLLAGIAVYTALITAGAVALVLVQTARKDAQRQV